jgi:hypothetical protein
MYCSNVPSQRKMRIDIKKNTLTRGKIRGLGGG